MSEFINQELRDLLSEQKQLALKEARYDDAKMIRDVMDKCCPKKEPPEPPKMDAKQTFETLIDGRFSTPFDIERIAIVRAALSKPTLTRQMVEEAFADARRYPKTPTFADLEGEVANALAGCPLPQRAEVDEKYIEDLAGQCYDAAKEGACFSDYARIVRKGMSLVARPAEKEEADYQNEQFRYGYRARPAEWSDSDIEQILREHWLASFPNGIASSEQVKFAINNFRLGQKHAGGKMSKELIEKAAINILDAMSIRDDPSAPGLKVFDALRQRIEWAIREALEKAGVRIEPS